MARLRRSSRIRLSTSASIGTEAEMADLETITMPKRKGRGRTRGLKLQKKRQQSADGKLDVLILESELVAVGPGRNDFITDLSIIVHQNAPHNVRKWKLIPEEVKNEIVQIALKNWRLQDTELVRKAILEEANRLYRNWRNRLHRHYLSFQTKEEALNHAPDEISQSDWEFLVDHFDSPEFKKLSTMNKAIRAQQKIKHTCGQKSFRALSYDARDPVTGEEPDMQKLWQMTHMKSNGEWVDKTSKEVNDTVLEHVTQGKHCPEESRKGVEAIEPEVINTALRSIVGGKSGYLRGCGAVPSSSKSPRIHYIQTRLAAKEKEAVDARRECDEVRAKLDEVESVLREERLKGEEMEARIVDLQNQKQENGNSRIGSGSNRSESIPQVEKQRKDEDAKQEFSELEGKLAEAESLLKEERLKREEMEAHLVNRQNEMLANVNSQVQAAIQAALSQTAIVPHTNEERASSSQQRRMRELEAQLQEAEDVITDLRIELNLVQRRLERAKNTKYSFYVD